MAAPARNFRINIVGFLECSNGRTCDMHPYGCGNILVLEHPDNGVGMVLRLRMYVRNELAAYSLNPDGSDGCRVGFASREFPAGPNGVRFDGALVRLITVYTADHENPIMGTQLQRLLKKTTLSRKRMLKIEMIMMICYKIKLHSTESK